MSKTLDQRIAEAYKRDGKLLFGSEEYLRNRRELARLLREATGFDLCPVPRREEREASRA